MGRRPRSLLERKSHGSEKKRGCKALERAGWWTIGRSSSAKFTPDGKPPSLTNSIRAVELDWSEGLTKQADLDEIQPCDCLFTWPWALAGLKLNTTIELQLPALLCSY